MRRFRQLSFFIARVVSLQIFIIHSSIGSNEKSALLSAPHTDHRLRFSLLLNPPDLNSSDRLRESIDNSESSLFNFISSASNLAASSASGISSMVSSELIDGDRDRSDVGVLGMLEVEPNEYVG